MKRTALVLSVTLSLASLAFAHGDMEHVLGTVVKVTDQSLSVKLSDGSIRVVLFDGDTHFLKGDTPAAAKDVEVGSRVVIHAHKHGDELHAVEVKIGKTSAPTHRFTI